MTPLPCLLLLIPALFLLAKASARSETDVSVPNLDFKDGLAHWQVGPVPSPAKVEAIPQTTREGGGAGLRLVAPAAQTKLWAESDSFPVAPGQAFHLEFWGRNVGARSNAGVFLSFRGSDGKELNNRVRGLDFSDQDLATLNAPPESGWVHYAIEGLPPTGTVSGSIQARTWTAASIEVSGFHLSAFEPVIAPPWPSVYKLSAKDAAKLTEADVVGPDGRVYPDWRLAGVPGGIPQAKVAVPAQTFAGMDGKDISGALDQAVGQAAKAGGGAIELPPGLFYLDRPLIVDRDNVVLRGAGRDKTKIVFRDRIAYGKLRFFNWAGLGSHEVGPGGTVELQANPKGLVALTLSVKGAVLEKKERKLHWGNTFSLALPGADALKKLGAGHAVLEGTAEYENGDRFTATFDVDVVDRTLDAPVSTFDAAVVFGGRGADGDKVLLAEDGKRGQRRVRLASAQGFQAGDRIRIEAPATPRWNALVRNHCPWGSYRLDIYEVAAVEGDTLVLAQPLRIEFPAVDGAWVRKIRMISGSGIEGLTLEQAVVTENPSGPKIPITDWYSVEDLWTNGVTFSYAWGCWARDIRVVDAGRNPLYLPLSKFCEIRDSEFDNSLFKGGGGTAYIGFESAFDCLMTNVDTHRLRHAPDLQWGASGNVVRASRFEGSDAQFHAGWTNENLLEGNTITASADDAENGGYGFGVFASGPASLEHGPQGPRNVLYGNDVSSPSDGLMMVGGNEAWLVLYNRFRVAGGRAVVGREITFDHRIEGNVFAIAKPVPPAVYFRDRSCTGVELVDNRFYGVDKDKVSGFRGGFGSLARDEGNTVLPYDPNPPMPAPAVASIYLWEKENGHPAKP